MRGLTKSESVADIKPTKWESILEERQEIHGDDKSIITNIFNLDRMERQQRIQEDVDNKLGEFVSDFETLLKDAKANPAKKLPREIVNYFFNANNDLLKRFPKQYDTLCQLKVDANKLISEKENQMNEMIRSVDSDVNELISQKQKQKKMSKRITLVDSEKIVQSVLAKPATKIQTIFRQYKTRKLEEKAKKQETINTSRSHAIKVIDEVQSMWWKAKKNGSWAEEMITMKHNLSELMQSATLATTVDELDNVKKQVNNIKEQLLASKNIEPSQMLADVSPISLPASEKPSWFQQRWQAFKQSSIVNILSRLVKLLKKAIWSSESSLNTPLSPLKPTAAKSLHKEEEDGIELTDLSAGSSPEEQLEEKPSPKQK